MDNGKLYHGTAWYPELWDSQARKRDIYMMKKAGINLVRLGEYTWSLIEPKEGDIDVSPLGEYITALHAEGIDTVLCTPTQAPPVWMTHGHPERCFVDASGTVMGHGSRQHICTNNAYFRERAAIIAERLAEELSQLPGLIAWQLDNEFKAHVAECFCPTCRSLWHGWLEHRYGSIDALNEAWGTGVWSHTYLSFDQVPQPGPTPFLHNSSLQTMHRLFAMEAIAGFAAGQAAAIRRFSDAPITHNSSVAFHLDNAQLFAGLDFASFDSYASPENRHAYLLNCDLWRNLKPGRPFWVMETSPSFAGSLRSYAVPHPAGYVKAEAVAAYALGAGAFCYWLWRQHRSGSEQTHGSVLGAWGEPALGYEDVLEVSQARLELEPFMRSSVPAQAEVAIVYSDRTKAFLTTEPHRGLNYRSLLGEFYKRIAGMGIHRDLIPESAEEKRNYGLLRERSGSGEDGKQGDRGEHGECREHVECRERVGGGERAEGLGRAEGGDRIDSVQLAEGGERIDGVQHRDGAGRVEGVQRIESRDRTEAVQHVEGWERTEVGQRVQDGGRVDGRFSDNADALTQQVQADVEFSLSEATRRLKGYRLLFTPFVHALGKRELECMKAYVQAGGVWIAGPLTGGRTEEHTIHTGAGLGELEELAGVKTKFIYPMEGTGSVGRAFGVEAPLSLWSAVFETIPGLSVSKGEIVKGRTPGLSFLTERAYGRGLIVLLGSLPAGEEGDKLMRALIGHYAGRAGVTLRSDATGGTVVCPRRGHDGRDLWAVVNMDGAGGSVTLPPQACDAVTGAALPPGLLSVGAYEYRLVSFPAAVD